MSEYLPKQFLLLSPHILLLPTPLHPQLIQFHASQKYHKFPLLCLFQQRATYAPESPTTSFHKLTYLILVVAQGLNPTTCLSLLFQPFHSQKKSTLPRPYLASLLMHHFLLRQGKLQSIVFLIPDFLQLVSHLLNPHRPKNAWLHEYHRG